MRNIDLGQGGNFISGTTGFRIEGVIANDRLGTSVSNLGDINGDGIDDFAVGALGFNFRTAESNSYVTVIFGKSLRMISSNIDLSLTSEFIPGVTGFTVLGFASQAIIPGALFFLPMSSLGDINGDGISDFIIGEPNADPNSRSNAGEGYVIYGRAAGVPWPDIDVSSAASFPATAGFKIQGAAAGDHLGASVSGLGDINGDGISDFIIGATNADPNSRSNAGEGYVIYGRAAGVPWPDIDVSSAASFPATAGFKIQGAAAGDHLGASVSGLGDINGDGISDFIIGASDAGEGYVIYGRAAGVPWPDIDLSSVASFPATAGFKIQGTAAGDLLGRSVSGLGDINGDGISDFIIGAINADPSSRIDAGEAYVIYGRAAGVAWPNIDLSSTTSFPASAGFKIQGAAAGGALGISVSGLGDINGDGISDFIIGASDVGEAYVIYGRAAGVAWPNIDLSSTTSFPATAGFKIQGAAAGDLLGISVSGLGDVNGDGASDFIIGASAASPNSRSSAGEAVIIFGTCTQMDYELPNISTFSDNVCTSSGNIIDVNARVSALTIDGSRIISSTGRIDLSGSYTSLIIRDSEFTTRYLGADAAINLSGAASLTFTGANTLDAGNGYVFLPAQSAIIGTPTVMGITCFDSAFVIPGDISSATCYSGAITTSLGSTALSINSDIRSLSGRIDLTGATGSLTIDTATLDASNFTGQGAAIDLSGASSLTFTGVNTLDAGNSGSISLPSGFRITGTAPTTTGTLSYATEQGGYTIATTPVTLPSTATGNINTSLSTLVVSDDITSTTGRIDLSAATTSLTIDTATLSASSFAGQGAAIDLSGASSLRFNGANTLDAGNSGMISLPSGFRISGTAPATTGILSYAVEQGNFLLTFTSIDFPSAAMGDISTQLRSQFTINDDITSVMGSIDFSAALRIIIGPNVTLSADNFSGSGAAIDLSLQISTLFVRFIGINALDAGNGYVLLPPQSRVSGIFPTVTGTACFDSAFSITGDVSSAQCYSDAITTSIGSNDLAIASDVRSLSNRIDLTGATDSITLNSSMLDASGFTGNGPAIDLSAASSLTFTGVNTLDAGNSGSISLPSGFRITGTAPTTTGIVNYNTETGAYAISSTPIAFPSSAMGDITTSLANLVISDDVTSTTGRIDLTGITGSLTIDTATLSANSFTGNDPAIDLSGASSLTFTGVNTLDAGNSGSISLPSGFRITGTAPTTTGIVNYNTETGAYAISSTPIAFPSSAMGDITTSLANLVISDDITSTTGRIDLTGASTALTVDGVTLHANNFAGQGAAIDLSGAASLTFTGANTLDAGSGYALLPAQSAIMGTLPTVTGTTCFDSAFTIMSGVSSSACYSGTITTSLGSTALSISSGITSLSGRIDLTGAIGSLTLNVATLDASNFSGQGDEIDLSGASSLTFTGVNTLDAGNSGSISLPSGFRITGTAPTTTGIVNYNTETGAYAISSTPIAFPSSAMGDITTSLANLVISDDVTSTTGRIDLTGVTGSLTIDTATLDASNFTAQGAAIDLSTASSLTFTGANTLDAGNGYALLPAQSAITGTLPTVTGIACFDSAFMIMGSVSSSACYSGTITTSLGSTALSISSDIRSLSGRIDLTGAIGSLTLNVATLDASNFSGQGDEIDLSGASSLIFTGANTLDAGNSGSISLPSGFRITGTAPTTTGIVNYNTETGAYAISSTPIAFPSSAMGDITTSLANLVISDDVTSTTGRIDLTGITGSLTIDTATLSANSFTGNGFAIDLSGTSSLTFTGVNTLDAGNSGSISLPSGFRITGTAPTTTGIVNYNTETGAYAISSTPIAFPSSAMGDITTSLANLVISDDITSTTGRIDLTGASAALTVDGVTLRANSFTGQGVAIDISGANSLTFTGSNTLDAGNGYVLLPAQSAIMGTLPTVTGTTCFDSAFTIMSGVSSSACYSGTITTSLGSTALSISSDIRSLSGRIDLTGITGSLTIDTATLSANSFTGNDPAIDLSGTSSLTFTGVNTLDAGNSGSISLPSGFRITGTAPTTTGIVNYNTETGAYAISSTPIAFPSSAMGDITTSLANLVISDDITSTTGRIDLTGASAALTVDGATLHANNFTGQGAAIDLSGANSLTFTGASTLDAGTGYVLLPAQSAIMGTLPTVTGTTCFDSAFVIPGDISSATCYSGAITTSLGSTALSINSGITSLSGRIDLTGAIGSLTLNVATLDASNFSGQGDEIDLSGASSLTFTGVNTLDAGNSGSISLPSGFRITGTAPTTTGIVNYNTETGAYAISSTPIAFPSSAMGDITTSLANLVISDDITSTTGRIDLTGVTGSLTIDTATLSANSFTGNDPAIDLSGTSSLTFTGANTLDAGNSGSISLPSGFRITGTAPTTTGIVNYNTETGAYAISSTPIAFPSSAMGDITTSLANLVISDDITSTTGRIDLTGVTGSLTIDTATLDASNFTAQGAAIDLSGAASLTFTGSNTLDAGNGYVLLPAQSAIMGTLPTVTGTTCFDSAFTISENISSATCYNGTVTVISELNDLTIVDGLRSLEGQIDLSEISGTVTLTDSVLRADSFTDEGAAINISNASRFNCNNGTLDAGEGGQIHLPPASQVTDTNCIFIGNVNYAPEPITEENNSSSTGAIVGGVLGGLAGVAALIGIIGGAGYYVHRQGGFNNALEGIAGVIAGIGRGDTEIASQGAAAGDDVILEDIVPSVIDESV